MSDLGKLPLCGVNALSLGLHQATQSDLAGCTQLSSPRRLAFDLSLDDALSADAPLFSVCLLLRRNGWSSSLTTADHTPADQTRHLTSSRMRSRKAYYQCLLLLDNWFAAGLRLLPRFGLVSYYRLMLAAPDACRNAIPPGLSASCYEAELRLLSSGSGSAFGSFLTADAAAPKRKRASSSDDIVCEFPVAPRPRRRQAQRGRRRGRGRGRGSPSSGPFSSSSDSSSSSSSQTAVGGSDGGGGGSGSGSGRGSDDDVVEAEVPRPLAWPSFIHGQPVYQDRFPKEGSLCRECKRTMF